MRGRYPLNRTIAAVVSVALSVAMLPGGPAQGKPASDRLKPQVEQLDGHGGEVAGKGWGQQQLLRAARRHSSWPSPGSAQVDLNAARGLTGGRTIRAGGLPVWLEPTDGSPARLDVQLLDRAKVPAAWRDGLLVRLTSPDGKAGAARVSVDYSGFRDAIGGNWASRLRLWQVPECALSTPERTECKPSQLRTSNDLISGVATAQAKVGAGSLVALSAGASGSGGDFSASTLSPSATWSSGGSSGNFSWNYPLRMVPTTGPQPSIALAYSSSSVDGRSEATNNQPSWAGEGFEYSPGYIERRYVPCAEDMENGANNTEKTGDMCWRSDNATMSLNGAGGELLYDAATGWHSRSEDGSKTEKLTGASNGDNDGEYWKVTTSDGTQYFFGRHSLPGQVSNTESVFTMPVFGNHINEPCRQATFAASNCTQAWRWNLDYVVDVRGNTMSYWYEKETNKYARNNTDSDDVTYVRGGVLKRIDYGTYHRTMAEHGIDQTSVSPVAQVLFDAADRCFANCWNGADPVKENWPDTPWDQDCKSTATECPQKYSPTFWTTKRLAKVTTSVWDTTKPTPAWQNVESWTLNHTLPSPGDGTNAGLWLDSIVHAGLVGGTATLPPVTFEPISMANRVLTAQNTTNNWLRISNIITETGAKIHVDYSLPECTSSNLPSAAHTNTMRCYPVIVPDLSADPSGETLMTEWWHKYVVTHVSEEDVPIAGGHQGVPKHTYYEYVGAPAWHHADDDGLSKPDRKTWSQFRGYATVKTRTGEDPATQTLQVTHFLRGMHGDRLNPSGGDKSITVPASLGSETVYDEDQFAGMVREQAIFNGVETKPVSKTVNVPWRSNPTASRTINGDTVESRFTNTEITYEARALGVDGARGWRTSRMVQNFDNTYGTANWAQNDGDITVTGDEKCTTYAYTRNLAKNLTGTVKRVTATALICGQNPSSADFMLSDVRNFYDGATSIDTAPVYGSMSRVDLLKDWTPSGGTVWQTVNQTTFDKTGRPLTSTDIKGNVTTTAYTPAVGGPVTRVITTGPAPFSWVSSVDILPYWGAAWKATDPNSKVTGEAVYDPLGRTWKVWHQGWAKAGHENLPSTEYTYNFPPNRDTYTYIQTKTLNAKGFYVTTYEVLDAQLRQRQTQTISANGDGTRVVRDTIYDAQGRLSATYAAHVEPGAPSGVLWWEPNWSLPSVDKIEYDRASRTVANILLAGDGQTNLVEKWRTTTSYEGDLTKSTPAAGGVPTTILADIEGRTTHLRQHTTPAGVGGAYDETRYEFNRKDQLAKVVDSAGNEWKYKFDAKGRQTEVTDPDNGTTTIEYNEANEVIKTTDARNEVVFLVYDQIGRRKELRDDSATGALRAEWKYDTLYSGQSGFRGLMTQAIRYEPAGSANAYKWQARSFDGRYQPGGINIVIPAVESGLNATYVYGFGYSQFNGAPITLTYPAAGNLPGEQVTTDYDNNTGMPVRLDTNWGGQTGTMAATWYTAFGESTLTQRKMPGGVYVDNATEYDPVTRRVQRTTIKTETGMGTVSDRNYTYDAAANVTSIEEKPEVGPRDMQCFRYDSLARLKTAWTPDVGVGCNTDPAVASLGGPARYWLDWNIDKSGNRLTETDNAASGLTTRDYTVPAGGTGVVRPHATTAMTTTAPGQSAVTVNYQYDSSGNTVCRPNSSSVNDCGTGAGSQQLTWNAEGKLDKVSSGGQVLETNIYDADSQRIIRRDASGTTLYLPGQEIRREGTVNAGTRYYTFAGGVVGSRTSGGLNWVYSDHQGTQQISVKSDTQAVDIRRQTPYGADRGASPVWPNSKGFVGGDNDPTGLVNIGMRHYDKQLGRFISDDPITDPADPQQMHGYSYASNNPTTYSDPTGLMRMDDGGGGGSSCGSAVECASTNAQAELDATKAEIEKAKKLKAQSFVDILLKEGLNLLLDMLGVNDIIDCFAKGDLMACGSMILSALPVGRVFKVAKSIWKAVDRGMSAFKVWRKTVAAAEKILSKADELLEAAQRKVDDALSRFSDPCHSFDPATPVLMADGATKPIGEVELGDQVTATDPATGETTSQPVTQLHQNLDVELTDVTVMSAQVPEIEVKVGEGEGDRSTRGPTSVLKTTAHHPFWDEATGSWVDAADLEPGKSVLIGPDGTKQFVHAVRNFTGAQEMRDLTVANVHTYYVVAIGGPILVHNNNDVCLVHDLGIPAKALESANIKPCAGLATCPKGGKDPDKPGGLDEGAPETADRRQAQSDEVKHQAEVRDSVGKGLKQEAEAIKAGHDPFGGVIMLVLGTWAKIKNYLNK